MKACSIAAGDCVSCLASRETSYKPVNTEDFTTAIETAESQPVRGGRG
jgi:hypothetical protein